MHDSNGLYGRRPQPEGARVKARMYRIGTTVAAVAAVVQMLGAGRKWW